MPKCTKALIDDVAEMVKLGVPPIVASGAHGVDETDFVEWMRRGQINGRGDTVHRKFYMAIREAEAALEAGLIGTITMSSIKDWKAAAWLAERRWPERYVRRPVGDAEKSATPGDGNPFDKVDKVVPLKAVQ